jgi:choline dehydrogenase-like flavoprotein
MEAIELLRRDALLRRNAKILAAKRDYYKELKAIKTLGRSLGVCLTGRPRKALVTEDASLNATTVAKQILLEGKRMTLRELTLEVQRRGCRSADDYRVVSHAINSGLRNYRRHLKRDEAGRWSVVVPLNHPRATF